MARIRILPDVIANRIAAGEVVERPASVLKELLENALDAEARQIQIRVEGGGRKRIEVVDDGAGMERDDALLAFERHATSKLRRAEDLDRVATLGFRGEALPSIGAVARVALTTASGDGGEGTRVVVHGGKLVRVETVGCPRGTQVRVDDLFYNTPARRRFLKAEATELHHVVQVATQYAAAYPGVTLRLVHRGRTVLDVPRANDFRDRLVGMLGAEAVERLIPFDRERDGLRVHGLVGRPDQARRDRKLHFLFVNRRLVRDRVLNHAVLDAHHTLLEAGQYPLLLLVLEMPPDAVDVNVHPAKTEVRFRDGRRVHDLVRATLVEALEGGRPVPNLEVREPAAPGGWSPAGSWSGGAGRIAASGRAGERAGAAGGGLPAGRPGAGSATVAAGGVPSGARQGRLGPAPPVVLGQYRDSYVVAADADGLLLVDQHAAHERVLYERFRDRIVSGRPQRQALLFPLTLELSPAESTAMDGARETWERLGFATEPFGDSGWVVREVPAILSERDVRWTVRALLAQLGEEGSTGDADRRYDRLAATIACHAAVTVNMTMDLGRMEALLADLHAARSPMTCPHGRPTCLRFAHGDIEKAFRRA